MIGHQSCGIQPNGVKLTAGADESCSRGASLPDRPFRAVCANLGLHDRGISLVADRSGLLLLAGSDRSGSLSPAGGCRC